MCKLYGRKFKMRSYSNMFSICVSPINLASNNPLFKGLEIHFSKGNQIMSFFQKYVLTTNIIDTPIRASYLSE